LVLDGAGWIQGCSILRSSDFNKVIFDRINRIDRIFKFILSSSSCKSCQIFIGIGRTEQPCLTTEAILTEFANSLTKPQWRQLAVDTIYDLRNDPDVKIISVSSDLFSKGLKLYSERLDKEWSLTDCISFEVMKERKLSNALTTDHHFEQAGFRALLLEPN